MQGFVFIHCLKLNDVNSHFLKWGECHQHQFGFQNYISVWGLKNDPESIPFSRFFWTRKQCKADIWTFKIYKNCVKQHLIFVSFLLLKNFKKGLLRQSCVQVSWNHLVLSPIKWNPCRMWSWVNSSHACSLSRRLSLLGGMFWPPCSLTPWLILHVSLKQHSRYVISDG